jgi:hypothetical protein
MSSAAFMEPGTKITTTSRKNTRRMLNPSPRFTIKLEKSVTRSFTAYRANLSPFAGKL